MIRPPPIITQRTAPRPRRPDVDMVQDHRRRRTRQIAPQAAGPIEIGFHTHDEFARHGRSNARRSTRAIFKNNARIGVDLREMGSLGFGHEGFVGHWSDPSWAMDDIRGEASFSLSGRRASRAANPAKPSEILFGKHPPDSN